MKFFRWIVRLAIIVAVCLIIGACDIFGDVFGKKMPKYDPMRVAPFSFEIKYRVKSQGYDKDPHFIKVEYDDNIYVCSLTWEETKAKERDLELGLTLTRSSRNEDHIYEYDFRFGYFDGEMECDEMGFDITWPDGEISHVTYMRKLIWMDEAVKPNIEFHIYVDGEEVSEIYHAVKL